MSYIFFPRGSPFKKVISKSIFKLSHKQLKMNFVMYEDIVPDFLGANQHMSWGNRLHIALDCFREFSISVLYNIPFEGSLLTCIPAGGSDFSAVTRQLCCDHNLRSLSTL